MAQVHRSDVRKCSKSKEGSLKASCIECKRPESNGMAQCDRCDSWTHHSCSGLPEAIVAEQVDKFYCTKCRDKYGLIHEWHKKLILTAEDGDEKARDYYEVAEIVAHKLTTRGRIFTVRWKANDELSELPERNLDGCLDLLRDYCIKEKIWPSKIKIRQNT